MKFILEHADYNNLTLPKGIILTNDERISMFKIINNYITHTYKISKYSPNPIVVDGQTLSPELLFKAANNRTLLKKLVYDERGEIVTGIETKEDLFNFVENNLFDLFNTKGKYFSDIYNLLLNTSYKGQKYENESFLKFEEAARKRGLNIKVVPPENVDEDIFGGIDGLFFVDNKRFTIQVKPLFKIENYKKDENCYIAFCDGVLKELKTDYLIITNKQETWIFRAKGIIVNSSFFIIPKKNLVS